LEVVDHFATFCTGEGCTAAVLAALGHSLAWWTGGVESLAMEAERGFAIGTLVFMEEA